MNKAANTYWTDRRLAAQRPATRSITLTSPARELSRELVGTRAEVRRRGGLVPSWVIFCVVIFATFALCVSVTVRTNAKMRASAQKHETLTVEVEALRNTNASLQRQVERLRTDPRAIEAAARERLNMTRPNEMVVAVR